MSVWVSDIEDPLARKTLLDYVGKEVLTIVTHRLGVSLPPPEDIKGTLPNWRQVRLDLTRFDKLDILIDNLILDLQKMQFNKFARVPLLPDTLALNYRYEHNGFSFRISIEMNPRPILTIDYAGWV